MEDVKKYSFEEARENLETAAMIFGAADKYFYPCDGAVHTIGMKQFGLPDVLLITGAVPVDEPEGIGREELEKRVDEGAKLVNLVVKNLFDGDGKDYFSGGSAVKMPSGIFYIKATDQENLDRAKVDFLRSLTERYGTTDYEIVLITVIPSRNIKFIAPVNKTVH